MPLRSYARRDRQREDPGIEMSRCACGAQTRVYKYDRHGGRSTMGFGCLGGQKFGNLMVLMCMWGWPCDWRIAMPYEKDPELVWDTHAEYCNAI